MFDQAPNRLIYRFDAEQLWIEAWGSNALRVRATKMAQMPEDEWALLSAAPCNATVAIESKDVASITNGGIKAVVSSGGKICVYNGKEKLILEEYARHRRDVRSEKCSALEIEAREFRPIVGGDYAVTARFESLDVGEKIFGMGQYQQPNLNLKGNTIELAHRNSQASVPFMISSLGYGLLWNNPAIGRAVLGTNIMTFEAQSTKVLDYWIVAGDSSSPAKLIEAYADSTGKVPMMPEYGMGFWQCKLRYQTQNELLQIAREYKKRDLPIDVIVVDFFHWPKQGEWKFDPTYWPDPDAMIQELQAMNIELMVSIWPTVDKLSENYVEMLEKGLLIRTERGLRTVMDFQGETVHFDATNPAAREYIWQKAKANYHAKGIKIFWLDEAEPEYSVYDFDNYRYHAGPNIAIGNIYPREYARAFYEGMTATGQTNIVNLLRCAWAGSQRYGALVWSGDIGSTWSSFRNQIAAGLNMGLSGFPWWTTDIGGFHGGDPNDTRFRELFVRWFQWGTFCPVMRLHGDREPRQPQHGMTGGATCRSGAANEVWSYGDEVYAICKKYMALREELRPYIRSLMLDAHEKGTPVMRTMFYEFPEDQRCWELGEQYMFGSRYLCCPVLKEGARTVKAYLPAVEGGKWKLLDGGETFEGERDIEVNCPLEFMPVFERLWG